MESTATAWNLTGDYFENCNCDVLCPCEISSQPLLHATPTQGVCDVAIAFHIDRGAYGATALDGLNAVVMAHAPGPMVNGDWSVALYLDERADDDQRAALQAIFAGQAGGPMGGFAPLISTVLGVKSVPITFTKNGMRRSLEIPGVAQMAVSALPGTVPGTEMALVGVHPFNLEGLTLAMGDQGSTYQDFGMSWDNSGKNGHYAPITWSNA
jgi:hypothetical protein